MQCKRHPTALAMINCKTGHSRVRHLRVNLYFGFVILISHGCRYSCWNFMKLQHHFHILLISRSKFSRTKSIHGLLRNKPNKKTCIHILHAVQAPPHGACSDKLCEEVTTIARYSRVKSSFWFRYFQISEASEILYQ